MNSAGVKYCRRQRQVVQLDDVSLVVLGRGLRRQQQIVDLLPHEIVQPRQVVLVHVQAGCLPKEPFKLRYADDFRHSSISSCQTYSDTNSTDTGGRRASGVRAYALTHDAGRRYCFAEYRKYKRPIS